MRELCGTALCERGWKLPGVRYPPAEEQLQGTALRGSCCRQGSGNSEESAENVSVTS